MGIILSFLKYIFLSNPIYVPYSQRSGTAYCPPLAQWEYPRPFWFKTLSYRRQASPCSQYAPLRGGTCHSPFSECCHRSFLMNQIRIAGHRLSLQLKLVIVAAASAVLAFYSHLKRCSWIPNIQFSRFSSGENSPLTIYGDK